MKQIQIDLPEKLADQIESLVREGWFSSEQELVRTALLDFLRHRRLELAEESSGRILPGRFSEGQ